MISAPAHVCYPLLVPFIGLYIHPWHTYGHDLLRGIRRFMSQRPDWECFLPWPSQLPDVVRLPATPLDGLIVRVGGVHDVSADFGTSLPRVVIASTDLLSAPVDIAWDNHHIGRLAGEHLLEQGHRRIMFVGRLKTNPYQHQRADGVAAALASRNLPMQVVDLDDDENALATLVRDAPSPSAVFAASDPLGGEVLHAARVAGRRVPDDIAVVAAGDNEIFCEMSSPPLSSVALPGEEAGFLAAARLHELITQGTRPPPVAVAPRYVTIRRSSDVLAMDDELIARAVRLIRRGATAGLTVDGVRAAVPLSRRALEVRFKKAIGRTIEQEILRVRLGEARKQLCDTDAAIAQIAERTGFPSAQRLSAVFAREGGESPSAYRQRIRKKS